MTPIEYVAWKQNYNKEIVKSIAIIVSCSIAHE